MRSQRYFDDYIEAYLDYTDSHESTERMRLWTCISILAAALERKVWLPRGFYTLYPNLYIFIVGKSGIVKKSTSTAIGVNILREVDDIQVMSERLTAASMIQQLARSQKTFKYGGYEVKQAASYIYASELHVFLGEVYGSTIELLTTFFDCIPHDSTKAWVNTTKHAGIDRIYGPCLNMLGASTLSWLRKSVPDSEMEGGFASRVIFVVELDGPKKFIAWPSLAGKEDMQDKLIGDMEIVASLIGPAIFDRASKQLFEDWYTRHMRQEAGQWSDSKFVGYMARKGDHILKLSMVRSVSLRDSLDVTVNDVEWAMNVLDDLEEDMFSLFQQRRVAVKNGDPSDIGKIRRTKDKTASGNIGYHIKEYMQKNRTATISTIRDNFIGFTTADNIHLALNELVGMGYLKRSERHGVIVYTVDQAPIEIVQQKYDI